MYVIFLTWNELKSILDKNLVELKQFPELSI